MEDRDDLKVLREERKDGLVSVKDMDKIDIAGIKARTAAQRLGLPENAVDAATAEAVARVASDQARNR